MLKTILNIDGLRTLKKKEQHRITGGFGAPVNFGCDSIPGATCAPGKICCQDVCLRPTNPICDPNGF